MDRPRRNEIRQEAGLPLLPVVQELCKMKRQDDLEEFERFAAVHREAILEQVLKTKRQSELASELPRRHGIPKRNS
jgi:hypothetical protein